MSSKYGKLYVVATPIGNLADISFRAIDTLKQADLIAAEDTRHIKMLLQHYGISNKLVSLHQHNEERASPGLLAKLRAGLSVALVSDAGTPLISDPGMQLVKMARQEGFDVVPIPGACALVTALSAAGLPVTRFTFEGFAPRTSAARRAFFDGKSQQPVAWLFYEASHRILESMKDLAAVLPAGRQVVIARELTKLHETIVKADIGTVLKQVENDENMRKGEFVVIVEGASIDNKEQSLSDEQKKILTVLLRECSVKSAVAMAAEMTGATRKLLYQAALEIDKEQQSQQQKSTAKAR